MAVAQIVHPYKMEVTASLAGRDLLPVIFQKVDDNTIFSAAVENRRGTSDTIFVALLDSCGNEKVSKRIVSKYTITDAKTFSVHPTQYGYILAISSHYQRLLFLDRDLNFERTRNILRFNNPVFARFNSGLMIFSKNPVANSVNSIAVMNSDGQKLETETINPKDRITAAICDENGNIYCVGSYIDGRGSHFFIAKFTEDGALLFLEAYSLEERFIAYEILIRNDEIVVLGIGPNSSFASLYFNQSGKLSVQKFYDLEVAQIFASKYNSENLHGGLILGHSGEYFFYSIGEKREIRFSKVESTVYENNLFNAGWGLQGILYSARRTMKVSGISKGEGIDYCGVSKEVDVKAKNGYSITPGEPRLMHLSFSKPRDSGPFPAKQAKMNQIVNWRVENECPGVLKGNFSFIDTILCDSDSLQLTSRITRGTPTWNIGDTAQSIAVDTSGVYISKYSEGLCGAIDYQRVRFLDSAEFGIPMDSSFCGVDTLDFQLPADLTYSWQFPDGSVTSSPKILLKHSGQYILTVHSSSCLVDTIDIGVYEFPEAKASPDGALCKGDTVTLQGDGGESYLWTPADFLSNDRLKNPKAFPPNTQLYRVVVASREGCHDTDFVNLEVHPYAKADFTPGSFSIPFSAENIQFTNQSVGANQFAWFVNGEHVSNKSNFEFELVDTGLFYIKMVGKNNAGCNDSIEQQIRILPVSVIHIPNAFTPNGDGINETFAPSTFYFKEYEMTIFSRWGQHIWKSRNGEAFPAWDATMDQSMETVPLGTYQYLIKAVTKDGRSQEYTGKVHVVK